MRQLVAATLALGVCLVALPPAPAVEPPKPDLAEQVRKAIDGGKKFLLGKQNKEGNWEDKDIANCKSFPGGHTALALLALMETHVPTDPPEVTAAIRKGVAYLRTIKPTKTYVVALQTMVLARVMGEGDRKRIEGNVQWLLKSRLKDGWTYSYSEERATAVHGDNSNTQFALLALHAALEAGVTVDRRALAELRTFYVKTQIKGKGDDRGAWIYSPNVKRDPKYNFPALTMTTAGLSGLIITGLDLKKSNEKLDEETGVAEDCGDYGEYPPVRDALKWLGNNFPANLNPDNFKDRGVVPPFYCLYGIERAGRLSGQRYFEGKDWYRIGASFLVRMQEVTGSWKGTGPEVKNDHWPVVATSFALLFLGKGQAPVLISKFAWGARTDTEWNNKHNGLRHLVGFASRELFKNAPLGWQVFNVREAEAVRVDDYRRLAGGLLESPIVFFNGHWLRLTPRDIGILKEYVANGGFLFVEACCGHKDFNEQFREVVKELFPGNELKPLPADHPLWTASGKESSPRDFPLKGIVQGCKTVLVYSPKPVSGYWEANATRSARGRKAFELGANVIAYATGMELPDPRGRFIEIASMPKNVKFKEGAIRAVQLRYSREDWQPAPMALRNLIAEVRQSGVKVPPEAKPVRLSDERDRERLKDYRFLYMHGRKTFKINKKDWQEVYLNLKSGSTLLADACCGSKQFDKAFRQLMTEMWSEEKLKLEPIPTDDPLFGKELNGEAINTVRCRREGPGGKGTTPFRNVPPQLEGIKYSGRWVVIYSRYDLGCALERHKALDCLGHDFASALRLGKAALLSTMKE